MRVLVLLLALVLLPKTGEELLAQPPQGTSPEARSVDDATLWAEWKEFSEALAHLPPGQTSTMEDAYAAWLASRKVSRDDALARFARINESRRGSVERERLYWNVAFKLGRGPNQPLRILQETVQGLRPGRALEPGIGRGRNSIYLASIGWDVTGYDNAPDALTAAENYAKQAGVTLKTMLASHDDFDFGVERWDLIVNAYNYMDPLDPKWPERLWRALKPGGLIVWQHGGPVDTEYASRLATAWKRFRMLRFEQPETLRDDWQPNRPYVRWLLKKVP